MSIRSAVAVVVAKLAIVLRTADRADAARSSRSRASVWWISAASSLARSIRTFPSTAPHGLDGLLTPALTTEHDGLIQLDPVCLGDSDQFVGPRLLAVRGERPDHSERRAQGVLGVAVRLEVGLHPR